MPSDSSIKSALGDASSLAIASLVTKLLGPGRSIRYPAGNTLFLQGDTPHEVQLILSGAIKLVRSETSEFDVTIGIRSPGWLLGVAPLILEAPHPARAVTMVQTETRPLSAESFKKLLRSDTDVLQATLRILAEELLGQVVRASRQSLDIRHRVQMLLSDLAETHGRAHERGWMRIHLPLSQQEIADLVVASRESVNRAMKDLRRSGYITEAGGWISVKSSA